MTPGSHTEPTGQLDAIVVDPGSKEWLKDHLLMPSQWEL
jgi:hypothetical protein